MPKNRTGIKCVKCGCSFESEKFNSRNIKRKVSGKVFYPKYINFYKNVREKIVISPSDVLCNSCYQQIDRCKVPPEENCIRDLRLNFVQAQQSFDYLEELIEPEGVCDIMSNNILKTTKRGSSTPEANNATPAKVCKSSNVPYIVSANEANKHGVEDVDQVYVNRSQTKDIRENEMPEKSLIPTNEASEQGPSNSEDPLKQTGLRNDSIHLSQDVTGSGLSTIIREMVKNDTFYNDSLLFTTSNCDDLNIKVNRELLHLWNIKHRLACHSRNHTRLDPLSMRLLTEILKFIHTSETPTFNVFCEIFKNSNTGIVNNFLLGLFLYKSLSGYTKHEIKKLGDQISSKKDTSCPVVSITKYFIKTKNKSINEQFQYAFNFIEENFDVRDTLNVLDGEEINNFSFSQKFYFYFWLYHKCSSQQSVDILDHVLSTLRPFSLEAEECFTYANSDTNSVEKIRVHSFILAVRQQVNFHGYAGNMNIIHSTMYKNSFSNESVRLFIEVLYFGRQRFKKIKSVKQFSSVIDLAHIFLVHQPNKLFLFGDIPQTASDVRVLVELFLKTGMKKYIDILLKYPGRYLVNTFTKQLLTSQMYTLLIQDELQYKESQVYNLIKEFADNECSEDEDECKSAQERLRKLVGTVRFGLMTTQEFQLVDDESVLSDTDKSLFYYLIKHPGKKLPIPESFHQPTSQRKLSQV